MTTNKTKLLLLEIYNEEIPSYMQEGFIFSFRRLFEDEFVHEGIISRSDASNALSCYITPLRIACSCSIPIEDRTISIKGPKSNAPNKAIDGFMKKYNVDSELLLQENNGYYYYNFKQGVNELKTLIAITLTRVIQKGSQFWPKQMCWNSSNQQWIRPIFTITCLFDDEVIDLKYANVSSGRLTYGSKRTIINSLSSSVNGRGQRSLHEAEIALESSGRYLEKMRDANIIMHPRLRVLSTRIQAELCLDELNCDVLSVVSTALHMLDKYHSCCKELPSSLMVTIEDLANTLGDYGYNLQKLRKCHEELLFIDHNKSPSDSEKEYEPRLLQLCLGDSLISDECADISEISDHQYKRNELRDRITLFVKEICVSYSCRLSFTKEGGRLIDDVYRILLGRTHNICFYGIFNDDITQYKDLLRKISNMHENPSINLASLNSDTLRSLCLKSHISSRSTGGKTDGKFLFLLPDIIIEQVMVHHQFFIPIAASNIPVQSTASITEDAIGLELNDKIEKFLFSNEYGVPRKKTIVSGNENTLLARLRDAHRAFLFDEDIFAQLDILNDEHFIVVRNHLGKMSAAGSSSTMKNRCDSIAIAFRTLIDLCKGYYPSFAERFDKLREHQGFDTILNRLPYYAKLDLASKTVSELPDVQGKMGSYWFKYRWTRRFCKDNNTALPYNKLIAEISEIFELQYSRSISSQNRTLIQRCLLIAIKLEHVLFNYLANGLPSSSSDPFGIHRAWNDIHALIFDISPNTFAQTHKDCPHPSQIDKANDIIPLSLEGKSNLSSLDPALPGNLQSIDDLFKRMFSINMDSESNTSFDMITDNLLRYLMDKEIVIRGINAMSSNKIYRYCVDNHIPINTLNFPVMLNLYSIWHNNRICDNLNSIQNRVEGIFNTALFKKIIDVIFDTLNEQDIKTLNTIEGDRPTSLLHGIAYLCWRKGHYHPAFEEYYKRADFEENDIPSVETGCVSYSESSSLHVLIHQLIYYVQKEKKLTNQEDIADDIREIRKEQICDIKDITGQIDEIANRKIELLRLLGNEKGGKAALDRNTQETLLSTELTSALQNLIDSLTSSLDDFLNADHNKIKDVKCPVFMLNNVRLLITIQLVLRKIDIS